MNTEQCGIASVVLGAGRATKEDSIDYSAGILLHAKLGDYVQKGDTLATLYTNDEKRLHEAENMLLEALQIAPEKPEVAPLVHARVSVKGVEKY
jgi:pyrimidine-nucleoside phosphorylase